MDPQIYGQIRKKYGGKFVAFSGEKVVASGSTYKALVQEIERKKLDRKKLVIEHIEPAEAIIVYYRISLSIHAHPSRKRC